MVLWRLFTLHYSTVVAVSETSDTARLSRYRCLPHGGVWHAQPTLYMDAVRGTTVCEVTAMERSTSCGRSVVGTSRQRSCAVHSTDTAVTYVFTHGELYVAASRWGSPQNTHFFLTNFQTVSLCLRKIRHDFDIFVMNGTLLHVTRQYVVCFVFVF